MIKLLELYNFRGFSDAKLSGLAKVNLVTGLNGSGKTSILEAAFLISGAANASLSASLYGFRGESTWVLGGDRPFRSLFRNLDPTVCPKIVAASSELLKTSKRYRRELVIKPAYAVTQGSSTTSPSTELRGVTFEFEGPSGKAKGEYGWTADIKKLLETKPENPTMLLGGEAPNNPDVIQGHFVSPYVRAVKPSNHELLTQLLKDQRIGEVVDALKIVHPSLKSLQPLTEKNDEVIYADIGGPKLLPISLLGSGITNCLHIILPSLVHENGIIVVDEFEDGLHHTLHTPILKVVLDIAQRRKNQLFISSHSQEFIRHLISLMKERGDSDVAFFRIGRLRLKGPIPRYNLSEAENLLDAKLDIR